TEEEQLQRILAESFDISYPDFNQHQAMENLQKCYKEAHPPKLEQAPSVMISSSTQTSDNSKQISQLLQEQIKQQAQVIAMLQE
ncbi:7606_t:CDS:2, partial [Cetraspora pellucida]